MSKRVVKNRTEQGNILFLILIAVALFAALSYAVTSSTRGGSGNATDEVNAVSAAHLSQYPSGVRTAILRMIVSQNILASELEFDYPADFDAGSPTYGVFHPSAGGAIPSEAAPDIMAGSGALPGSGVGTWLYNSRYQVLNIGTDAADNSANDIIAFLPGIKEVICEKLNSEHGIGATNDTDTQGVGDAGPVVADIPTAAMNQDAANTGIGAYDAGFVIGHATNGPDFTGKPFACGDFDDVTAGTAIGDLVYYHVLVER